MPSGKPILIGICPFAYGTGLTRVMHTVMTGLSDQYEIHYLGIAYDGPVIHEGDLHIHPTNAKGGDVFAAFEAIELIKTLKPVAVFILHDIWMFSFYQRIFAPVRNQTKFVAYIPLDGNIIDESITGPLQCLDRVVVYTQWAKNEVSSAIDRIQYGKTSEPNFSAPPIGVVAHGVDLNDFQPEEDLMKADFDPRARSSAKQAMFPDLATPETSVVFLNASCPSDRKRVEITVEAFARFAENKPDNVYLCLHQAYTEDQTRGLVDFASERLGKRLIYNPIQSGDRSGAAHESELNQLYNACDVGVNTSAGEGWGLVSFEHAATGAVQVVPNHSACGALWSDETAVLIEPSSRSIPSYSPLEMAFVEPDDVATGFESLFQNRELLREKSRAAHTYATTSKFSWNTLVDEWRDILIETISG